MERNLLQKHFTSDQLKSIPQPGAWQPFPKSSEEWKQIISQEFLTSLIRNGEEALTKEFKSPTAAEILAYSRQGNRTLYDNASFANRRTLWDLVLAETLEGKGRFIDKIIDGVWEICEETFWGSISHLKAQQRTALIPDVEDPTVDLFAAETATLLAWTDYLVGDAMDKVNTEFRRRIRIEVRRRVFVPMETKTFGWMGGAGTGKWINNWLTWIVSNYLSTLLILEEDVAKRKRGVSFSIELLDRFLNQLTDDGACDEGPMYWFKAGGCMFDAIEILESALNVKTDILHEPVVQNMLTFISKVHIDGQYVINIGDAGETIRPDGFLIFRIGQKLNDLVMLKFGAWLYEFAHKKDTHIQYKPDFWAITRVLFNLSSSKEIINTKGSQPHLQEAWFENFQLMSARTKSGLFLSARGGGNGDSHNHNDVGDFTIFKNGKPVIIDIGRGTYTRKTFSKDRYSLWFNTSPYHNLPTINGIGQSAGKEFHATDVSLQSTPESVTFSLDIAKAYPESVGIKSWKRQIKVNREDGIELKDEYHLKEKPATLTQSFMTICEVDIRKPGIIAFKGEHGPDLILSYDASEWEVNVEIIPLIQPEDQAIKESWSGKVKQRILLQNKKLSTDGVFHYRIQ